MTDSRASSDRSPDHRMPRPPDQQSRPVADVGATVERQSVAHDSDLNVLVVLGHPRRESLCGSLAGAYVEGAEAAEGVAVETLVLAEMEFEQDVETVEPVDQEFESDLQLARDRIRWADHLAFVYPNWWGTMPARLKGFFDRTFTSGFAFSFYDEDEGSGHEELLDETTAELLVTMDMPAWVYKWVYRQPGTNAMKRATLGFAGIETTRVTYFGPVEDSTPAEREQWLADATGLGETLADGPTPRRRELARRVGAWLGALRLQFYPMAWAAYTIGALAAAAVASGPGGGFSARAYWLGLGFLCFLEAATVLSNEYVDYPTDRRNTFAGPFTGGSRVLVDGALDRSDLRHGIAATTVLAIAFGTATVAVGDGSRVALAGLVVAMLVLAIGYTVPPLALSYRTLGEFDVAVTHSVGVLLLGYVLMGGAWTAPLPWLLGVPFLLGVLPSITLAGVPDRDADEAVGKQTIAVRFGIPGAIRVAQAAAILAAATAAVIQLTGLLPTAYSPLIYLSVPHALGLVWLLQTRLADQTTPSRIDGLLVLALGYITWFAAVPLVELL